MPTPTDTDPTAIAHSRRVRAGLALGLATYVWWGLCPLYFKLLAGVPADAILAHRIVWSILLLTLVTVLFRQWPAVVETVQRRRVLIRLTISATLLAVNWLVFIYAVGHGRTLEASLGYFINPLVTVLLGVVFLGERLRRAQWAAIGIAGVGVSWFAWVAISRGAAPWIALTLPCTFGLYGLMRKQIEAGPLVGLFIETALLTPPAAVYLAWFHSQPGAALLHTAGTIGLLSLSGIVTTAPMVAFVAAAKRLPLVTLGFLQYINPTLQFLTAVLVFKEPFDSARAVAFAIIWTAVAIFLTSAAAGFRNNRAARRALNDP